MAVLSPIEDLLARWHARDELYRRRIRGGKVLPLSAGEISGVLANRRFEATLLPLEQRREALQVVLFWIPPTGPA